MNPVTLSQLLASRSLPGLDGLRMLAVLAVVCGHAGSVSVLTARHGVAAFFVLSGFLITWLLLKERDARGTVSLRDFYARRSLRIFPAYYVFLAFSITLDLARGDERIQPVIWPGVLYVINYYNALEGHSESSIAHAWSLAIEEQFYLLWPLLFLSLAKRGQGWLVAGLGVMIGAVTIWRSIAFSVLDLGTSYVYNAFDTRFDNLALGCLLAVLLRRAAFVKVAEVLAARPWYPLLTLLALHFSREVPSRDYAYGLAFTVDALLLGILLLQLLQLSTRGFWRWLEARPCVYLGRISYPMYLYHNWGLGIGGRLDVLPEALQFAAGVGVTVVLASLSYHVIEKPFLRLKDRFSSARPLYDARPPRRAAAPTLASAAASPDPATGGGSKAAP